MTAIGGIQPGKLGYKGAYNDSGPSGPEILNKMENLTYPEGFVPNFAGEPAKTWTEEHSLLGPITCRQYTGAYLVEKGTGLKRPVQWTVAEDGNGRVWIESISFTDSKINSYGVADEFINSGILTSKPLEYHRQMQKIAIPGYYNSFNDTYSDVTPALSLLKPIKDYRKARGLPEPGLKAPPIVKSNEGPSDQIPVFIPPAKVGPAPVIRMNSNTPGVVRVNGQWNVELSKNGNFPFSYEIGRGTFNDSVEHGSVSGQHLRIFRSSPNGPVWIQDLGSSNGTVIIRKGQSIYADKNPKVMGPTMVLHPGDEIRIGDVVMKVT